LTGFTLCLDPVMSAATIADIAHVMSSLYLIG
jgi:hypothetical protein